MSGLGIYQPRRESPPNHNIYRSSTPHTVTDILGEVDFRPLFHDATMISVQVSVRSQKVDKYGAQYVEFMSEFDVDRRIEMDRSSQLGT